MELYQYILIGLVALLVILICIILIRAAFLNGSTTALLYPYYFLDLNTLGWGGFLMWLGILFAIFVVLGYVFYLFDNYKKFKKHKNDAS